MDLPSRFDILCGKTSTNKHPGNVLFRQLILTKVDDYMSSTKKAQKGLVTAEVLDELHQIGARFVKLDKKTMQWRAISAADAREKVSHAIRDRVRERKKGKIVLPTSVPLPSTSTAKDATVNEGSSKRTRDNKTQFKKNHNAHKVKSNATVDAVPEDKVISVDSVQGVECMVSLTRMLQENSQLVSDDDTTAEDCSCSWEQGSTMISLQADPSTALKEGPDFSPVYGCNTWTCMILSRSLHRRPCHTTWV